MLIPQQMENLLRCHLRDQNLLQSLENQIWTVQYSKLGGRGLFAKRDIKQGEVVFVDKPLILGPRCHSKYLPMCVNCYKSGCPLFPCDNGCGLPVCSSECENSTSHINMECKYLQHLQPTCGVMWSMDLLQAVVPIRSLTLSDNEKELVLALQCHEGRRHGQEIDLLEKNIANAIDGDDKEFMLKVSQVFDTNAFETATVVHNSTSISLRGLYPLAAMKNHCCVPNTRHYFNKKSIMITKAAIPIAAGEELTMPYTDLLWDTAFRKRYLLMSKNFECNCKRCFDPTEFGSNIGALKCANSNCFGLVFPDNPLNANTSWTCRECSKKVSKRQIDAHRSKITAIVNEVLTASPRKMLKYIESELHTLVPMTNHIMLDMKFHVISYFGRVVDLKWNDLTDEELELKANYCNDLIAILDQIRCGDCQKKGLILYEFYCTKKEQLLRKIGNREFSYTQTNETNEYLTKVMKEVMEILQDDIAAPDDLKDINFPIKRTFT